MCVVRQVNADLYLIEFVFFFMYTQEAPSRGRLRLSTTDNPRRLAITQQWAPPIQYSQPPKPPPRLQKRLDS